MSPLLLLRLAGVALLVLAANILCSVLYMVVYGHLINPGHDNAFYEAYIQVAAPYCSIVAGIPLMLLAGWWVAGWKASRPAVRAALVVWGIYASIDGAIIALSGAGWNMLPLFMASFATKLVAVWAGAALRSRRVEAA